MRNGPCGLKSSQRHDIQFSVGDWKPSAAADCGPVEGMYTGRVVRLRALASILVLLVTATPVLAVLCEMDCEQRPATSACHTSDSSSDGPIVRGAQHACDHDHSTGSPALLANTSARDSVGTFVALPVSTLAHTSVADARVPLLAMHGPPGLSGRSSSSHTTVLRI